MKKYLFIVLALVSTSVIAQPLKLNLAQGSKYEVSTSTKVSSVASVMGQSMETTASNESVENFDIKSIAANNNELTAVLKKIVFSMSMMGQDMSYDSDKGDAKGELAELGKSVNKQYQVLYNDNGAVLNKDVVKSSQPAPVMAGMITTSVNVSLFDEPLLGKEIKEGASWYDSTKVVDDKATQITKGTYKVLTMQNGLASILFEGTLDQSGVLEQMGMEMNTSGTSTLKKEIMLDTKTGLVVQVKSTTEGTTNIEVGGMSIPTEVKTTSTKKIKLLPAQ